MWRSVFMALGIFLIFLGLQSLVVDQFVLTMGRSVPNLVSQLSGGARASQYIVTPSNPASYQNQVGYQNPANYGNPQARTANIGIPQVGQSQYGPSRYNQIAGGQGINAFNGQQAFRGQQANPNYDFASYSKSQATALNPTQAIQVTPSVARPYRIIQTQDWMPWSLIAAGTLIVLYSRPRGYGSIEE